MSHCNNTTAAGMITDVKLVIIISC